jgi:hypothetical protein
MTCNDWKFGVGQTLMQERQEIERAKRNGLTDEYMAAQAQARMAEQGPRLMQRELARRRARHPNRQRR